MSQNLKKFLEPPNLVAVCSLLAMCVCWIVTVARAGDRLDSAEGQIRQLQGERATDHDDLTEIKENVKWLRREFERKN